MAVKASATASTTAASASPHFAINVGLFAKDANARKVRSQLQAAKLPVYTQELHTSKGKLTRVRVGPFKSRAKADAAAQKAYEGDGQTSEGERRESAALSRQYPDYAALMAVEEFEAWCDALYRPLFDAPWRSLTGEESR